jgi:AcrR family transcriptional regulator
VPSVPHKAPKRRPGRPRSEGPTPEYLKRQAEIVAVATDIFRVKGDAAGTLQEVADTLGLQRASLYHYVHSKAHLLSLVCEQVLNAIIRAIEEVRGIEDPTERLVAAVRVHVATIVEHQAVFTVFFDDRASLSDDDKARLRDLEIQYVEAFTATVAAAIDAGVLPRIDPRQAALALIGLGSWPYKWFDADRHDLDSYADTCLSLLLQRTSRPARPVARPLADRPIPRGEKKRSRGR